MTMKLKDNRAENSSWCCSVKDDFNQSFLPLFLPTLPPDILLV